MIIFQFIVFIRSQLFSDIVLDYFGLISDEFIAWLRLLIPKNKIIDQLSTARFRLASVG